MAVFDPLLTIRAPQLNDRFGALPCQRGLDVYLAQNLFEIPSEDSARDEFAAGRSPAAQVVLTPPYVHFPPCNIRPLVLGYIRVNSKGYTDANLDTRH